MPSLPRFLPLSVVLLLGAMLTACVGAPVQEMFDARQALRAAQKAGAAQYAPELLGEAQSHLKKAETNLHSGDYRTARDEADQARAKAMEARKAAEAVAQPKKP